MFMKAQFTWTCASATSAAFKIGSGSFTFIPSTESGSVADSRATIAWTPGIPGHPNYIKINHFWSFKIDFVKQIPPQWLPRYKLLSLNKLKACFITRVTPCIVAGSMKWLERSYNVTLTGIQQNKRDKIYDRGVPIHGKKLVRISPGQKITINMSAH